MTIDVFAHFYQPGVLHSASKGCYASCWYGIILLYKNIDILFNCRLLDSPRQIFTLVLVEEGNMAVVLATAEMSPFTVCIGEFCICVCKSY